MNTCVMCGDECGDMYCSTVCELNAAGIDCNSYKCVQCNGTGYYTGRRCPKCDGVGREFKWEVK